MVSLQKTLKKIERTINVSDLKRFISACRETKDSNYIEPDQFLFLVAISRKKSGSSGIFFERRPVRNLICTDINAEIHEEKSKDDHKAVLTEVTREKVRGLSMHLPNSNEKLFKSTTIFRDIRNCLHNKQRAKSVQLDIEMKKNPRPHTPHFRKSVNLFRQAMEIENFMEKEKQNLDRFKQKVKKDVLFKKKSMLKLKGRTCKPKD